MGYEFTLTFALPEPGADPEQFLGALFEAGCDDALIGVGQAGTIALDFDRDAKDAAAAIQSAVAAVGKAIPGAELIEASPDLIGLTDVSTLLGCSRQMARKYVLAKNSDFPKPVHAGNALALWHLVEVARWAERTKRLQQKLTVPVIAIAEATWNTNLQIQIARYKQLSGTSRRTIPAAKTAVKTKKPASTSKRKTSGIKTNAIAS